MQQGRKSDSSPFSSAARRTDSWLRPSSSRSTEKQLIDQLLDDAGWFEDEHEITSASNFDHLMITAFMVTAFMIGLYLVGLI